ncbi:hypothetical protein TNCV_4521051 [Trichonephila clavipes]|nr:hypothetical protein TNCV_4521051 [Trichonephila clavipes]
MRFDEIWKIDFSSARGRFLCSRDSHQFLEFVTESCSFGKKCYGDFRNFEARVKKTAIHYRERKLLSGIDVLEKADKVSKTTFWMSADISDY